MILRILLLLAFSVTNFAVAAPEDLCKILDAERVKHHYPALAAAVIRNGSIVAAGAVGVRKWGDDISVQQDDAFHLGSCTKAMTAAIIAMLVEEGKLHWDTTLGNLFADLQDGMHDGYRSVTVDHLLAHRGGCPSATWPQGKTFEDMHNLTGTAREQREQYVTMILRQPPEAAPGTQYIYSNAGYTLLGAIAERVGKKPWEQLMRERLFVPINMTTAGFGPMGTPDRIDQPWQHVMADGEPNPVPPEPRNDNPPAVAPSGQVHCSIGDWAKFIIALMKERSDGGLLERDTRRHLLTPQFGGNYAGGWQQVESGSGEGLTLQHDGSNTMNFALAVIIPNQKDAVLLALNRGGNLDVLARKSRLFAKKLFSQYPID